MNGIIRTVRGVKIEIETGDSCITIKAHGQYLIITATMLEELIKSYNGNIDSHNYIKHCAETNTLY